MNAETSPLLYGPQPQVLQLFAPDDRGGLLASTSIHLLLKDAMVIAVFYDGGIGSDQIFHSCNFVLN